MKELVEEINRIKKLMLVEDDEQQLTLFSDNKKPINLTSNE